ncbi:MAG: hypothetical protein ACU0GG_10455 [Paracoccaceae bacterium]
MTEGNNGNKLLLQMLADRLEAASTQDKAYGALKEPNFQKAVQIATNRLGQFTKINSSDPGALFSAGVLYEQNFLPETIEFSDLERLIEAARRDYYAYAILRWIDHCSGDFAPPCLKEWRNEHYLGLFKPPSRPKGVPKYANLHRNTLSVGEVQRLCAIGFKATRSKAGTTLSACDVIVEALEKNASILSYDAVETIWQNRDSLPESPALKAVREWIHRDFSY